MVDREAQHEASASLSALWLIDFQHGSDHQHIYSNTNGETFSLCDTLQLSHVKKFDRRAFHIQAILAHVKTP